MMQPKADQEALALSHVFALEPNAEHWSEGERREFLEGFYAELARHLGSRQGIVMRRGPGGGCDH